MEMEWNIVYGLLSFIGGMLLWTFMEYSLHNWVGHMAGSRNDFTVSHLQHHANVNEFDPWPKKVWEAIPPVAIIATVGCLCLGWSRGLIMTVGLLVAYTHYEFLHRAIHVREPRNSYEAWARKHHWSHHFNNPKLNHGVTTAFWDKVFGTYKEFEKVRVPERYMIVWLRDALSGGIKEQYAKDYELKRRKVRSLEAQRTLDRERAFANQAPE